jgi:hypothetical protein
VKSSFFFLVAHFLCDKTGDETKRQDENNTPEKRGDQTGFLTLIGLHMSFISSFGFPLPVTLPLSCSLFKSSVFRIKSFQSSELIGHRVLIGRMPHHRSDVGE